MGNHCDNSQKKVKLNLNEVLAISGGTVGVSIDGDCCKK